MSSVQNVILTSSIGVVGDKLDEVNKLINSLPTVTKGEGLKLLNDTDDEQISSYGGTKALEADVAVGAFNYLPLKDFIIGLREIFKDTDPYDVVQLIYNDQNDTGFRITTIFGDPEVENQG